MKSNKVKNKKKSRKIFTTTSMINTHPSFLQYRQAASTIKIIKFTRLKTKQLNRHLKIKRLIFSMPVSSGSNRKKRNKGAAKIQVNHRKTATSHKQNLFYRFKKSQV